jgi:KaiC/GvpD/RAD55 family RecA-like ATPase
MSVTFADGWPSALKEVAMFDPSRHKAFEFAPVCALLSPKPVDYLIDYTLETDSLSLVFGAPGMGKSFLAVDWAASIATGTPWQGRDVLQGAVFYIAGEGHSGLSRRLRAWEIKSGVSLANAPLYVSKTPAQLMDEASTVAMVNTIEAMCSSHGHPALIVIDTMARNMGSGDENSNADIAKLVAMIDQVKAHLKCAVLIVHHTGHYESLRARGGSALPAAVDSSFRMDGKLVKGKLADLALVHVKSKESELLPTVPLAFEQVTLEGWTDRKGRVMNSAVLVQDLVDRSNSEATISPAEQTAINSYLKAAEIHGKLDANGSFVGLVVADWKSSFYEMSGASSNEAKRKAFKRAIEALTSRDELTVDGGLYLLKVLPEILVHEVIRKLQAVNASS